MPFLESTREMEAGTTILPLCERPQEAGNPTAVLAPESTCSVASDWLAESSSNQRAQRNPTPRRRRLRVQEGLSDPLGNSPETDTGPRG